MSGTATAAATEELDTDSRRCRRGFSPLKNPLSKVPRKGNSRRAEESRKIYTMMIFGALGLNQFGTIQVGMGVD